jgi:hypothetical protein
MRALIWLDLAQFRNRMRIIARNPRRLLPWLLVVFWFVPSTITRFMLVGRGAGRHLAGGGDWLAPLAALVVPVVPGAALLLLGFLVRGAAVRAPAAFQSPADGRFLIGAGIDSRLVMVWVTLRGARRLMLAAAFYLVLLAALYSSWLGLGPAQAIAGALAIACFGSLAMGARLASFTGKRRLPVLPVKLFGDLLIGIGLIALAAAAGAVIERQDRLVAGASAIAAGLPPGAWVVGAFRGQSIDLAPLVLLTIACCWLGVQLAGDCLPELWESSTRAFDVRRAARSGGVLGGRPAGRPRTMPATAPSAGAGPVPGGAWIVAWKEWLALRRGRGGAKVQVAIMALAGLGGIAVGLAAANGQRSQATVAVTQLSFLAVLFGAVVSVRLGRDLRTPLWWLSADPLWSRLAVWTFVRALRLAVPLFLFLEPALLLAGDADWALAAPLLVLLVSWLLAAIGLGAYTVLPAATDYRLTQMLRVVLTYVAMVPLAAAAVPGILLQSTTLAIAVPIPIAVLEMVTLLAFATRRISGNGLAFAREERQ